MSTEILFRHKTYLCWCSVIENRRQLIVHTCTCTRWCTTRTRTQHARQPRSEESLSVRPSYERCHAQQSGLYEGDGTAPAVSRRQGCVHTFCCFSESNFWWSNLYAIYPPVTPYPYLHASVSLQVTAFSRA